MFLQNEVYNGMSFIFNHNLIYSALMQDLAIKKASSVRNELLAPIKNFASKLSKNSAKYGVRGENYYWTSCYHLNIRMYEKLLSSVFDNLEEDQLVEVFSSGHNTFYGIFDYSQWPLPNVVA